MKKNKFLILILCLALLIRGAALPAAATEASEEEATEATVALANVGDAAIVNGCRTMEGMSSLAGSDRILDTASAAFVYELNTDTLIYSYNPDLRLYPGSLSKMLTALIAIEYGELSDQITVSTREISQLPVGSITAGLKNGEVVTLEDVLYALILTSANDAALIVAEYVAGDEASFVKLMNERAVELGCTNTYFTNCHGLDDAAQYTTARDMARITKAAAENETFKEIFGATKYTIEPTNKYEEQRKLESGNHLVYDAVLPQFNDTRVTGGMPSYVSAASGASIAFTAEDNGMSLVVVLIGCTRTYKDNGWQADYYGNFNEALDVLEFVYNGYRINRVVYTGEALKTFQVGNGLNAVVGCPLEDIDSVVPTGTKMSNLIEKYAIVNGGLNAPIKEGDKIATVQLWYGTSCIAETELYAMSDISSVTDTGLSISSAASRDDSNLSDFLGFLGVLCLIILVPLAVYLTYNSIMRSRVRARRRRRRASRRRSR